MHFEYKSLQILKFLKMLKDCKVFHSNAEMEPVNFYFFVTLYVCYKMHVIHILVPHIPFLKGGDRYKKLSMTEPNKIKALNRERERENEE